MNTTQGDGPFDGLVAILRPNGTVKEISRRGKIVTHSDGPADRLPGEWRRVTGEEAAELYRTHCRRARLQALRLQASDDEGQQTAGRRIEANMRAAGTWLDE